MSGLIRCTCCQAEITAPQWYNGYPYGYTCIKKVDPSYKRTKVQYLPVESFKLMSDPLGQRHVFSVVFNGSRKQVVCYSGAWDGRTSSTYMQDGILYVAETNLK